MKTLWIVSGGMEAVPGIQHAKSMGLHVVVSDGNPIAPGFECADDKVIVSTYDVDATISAAQEYNKKTRKIDGVICFAADVPLTVATVASSLGLPSISVETARLAMDKLAMKRRFIDCGIPVPWFGQVNSANQLATIVRDRGLPLVIKPVDSRGARGVIRLTAEVDVEWAFAEAASNSPTDRVMVEEYLDGPQISTETVLVEGKAWTPGFADRNYEYLEQFAPYMIENGGQQPSILPQAQSEAVKRLAESAGRALGIKTGIAKGDMVLTPEGPKVIEIAARLSGGWFCTDQVPLSTGVDLVGAAVRLALGEQVNLDGFELRPPRGVAIRYFFPAPGLVKTAVGVESYAKEPWVHKIGFFVKPGDRLEIVRNHTQRAGFVITSGENREEAVARAQQVVRGVKIITEACQ